MIKKYIGVHRAKSAGRKFYRVAFIHNGVRHEFGNFIDEKECARAYDLHVIRKGLDRKTNFFKKKLSAKEI
jgi:hypothetical protein